MQVSAEQSLTGKVTVDTDEPLIAQIADSRKRHYLTAIVQGADYGLAARLAGISLSLGYLWRNDQTDPVFQHALKLAQSAKCDRLEAEIHRRAVTGIDVPVYQQGRLVGHRREYSDLLLIFSAKAEMPGKYRDNVNITGEVRMPVSFRHERDPDDPSVTAKRETQGMAGDSTAVRGLLGTPEAERDKP